MQKRAASTFDCPHCVQIATWESLRLRSLGSDSRDPGSGFDALEHRPRLAFERGGDWIEGRAWAFRSRQIRLVDDERVVETAIALVCEPV
jgi:hypothetical protein